MFRIKGFNRTTEIQIVKIILFIEKILQFLYNYTNSFYEDFYGDSIIYTTENLDIQVNWQFASSTAKLARR